MNLMIKDHHYFRFREFFQKIEKWNLMNSVPELFSKKIHRLRTNFEHTIYVYKKYGQIFQSLFICPLEERGSPPNSSQKRKKEKFKCTSKTLYEFCWCLFACAKGQLNEHDLVLYYNLLLCCCDFIYANVINENRVDLINQQFCGL